MKKNGFSLVELLVVIFIVGLISSIGFINYQNVMDQLVLNRAAHQVLQDLRKTQEMAMSAIDYYGQFCIYTSMPLHFASLSHLALGEPFEVSCFYEPIESTNLVTYTAEADNARGYLSYSWSGFASGCANNNICEKQIVFPDFTEASVAVTNSDGQIVSAECWYRWHAYPVGNGYSLVEEDAERIYYYGVYFNIDPNNYGSITSYRLYIDIDGPNAVEIGYHWSDCVVAKINIAEQGVIIKEIKNLTPGRLNTSIGFAPPNPDVNISGLLPGQDTVEIVLGLASDDPINPDPKKQRTISVNIAGLLEMK